MWPIVIMYGLLIPCVALYLRLKWKDPAQPATAGITVVVKALCTGIILVTAAFGLAAVPEDARLTAALVVVGLAFGLAGDVAISRKVEQGMLFFGLGHCFYIAAMYRLSDFAAYAVPGYAVPVFAVLYGLALAFYYVNRRRLLLGTYFLPGLLYAALLLGMVSIALTLPFSVWPVGAVFCVGALLFVTSDTMLAFTIARTPRYGRRSTQQRRRDIMWDTVCLYCYFIGQSLFTVGIFLLANIIRPLLEASRA